MCCGVLMASFAAEGTNEVYDTLHVTLGNDTSTPAVMGTLTHRAAAVGRTARAQSIQLTKQLGIEQSLRHEAEMKAAALEEELKRARRASTAGGGGGGPGASVGGAAGAAGATNGALHSALSRQNSQTWEQMATPVLFDEDQNPHTKLLNDIFAEILTSERSYVHDLQMARLVFLQPLRIMAAINQPLLDAVVIERMFSNWEQLIAVNKEFLIMLEKAMRADSCTKRMAAVNAAFVQMSPYFGM